MIGDFFIWCAGSDKNVLSQCEDSVRTKHIGIGTLVLIPSILGFISMMYALSTIDKISNIPFAYFFGGLIWGLIIFAFDRFIVSTHRKQQNNFDEFKNITFYLRLIFAVVLGIVISHPIVLLNFEGSITERIIRDRDNSVLNEEKKYQNSYSELTLNLNQLINRKQCNEQLLTAEQSGTKVVLPCGNSSGIPNLKGNFPRTNEIKKIIDDLKLEISKEQSRIDNYNKSLNILKESTKESIIKNTSFDYIKREKTLAQLKKDSSIVNTTEFLLMLVFILVDILPLIFKTFSPFNMYDKILYDDISILKNINIKSRENALQKAYDRIISLYAASKNLDENINLHDYLDKIRRDVNLKRNVSIGIILGSIIAFCVNSYSDINITQNELFSIATVLSILISIISNFITDFIKAITKITTK